MRHRTPADRRCTYLLVIEHETLTPGDLRGLGGYLSGLSVADCDVVIVDGSPRPLFERNRRTLRWVGRHVAVRAKHRAPNGCIDPIRAAVDLAACEKVIIAGTKVRYAGEALASICELLDGHEVVEPQDYFEPLPWWSSIEAGRMLVHRGVEPLPDHGATFGIRRSAVRGLRAIDSLVAPGEDHVRRLSSVGAEVHSAAEVFVRRLPPPLAEWIGDRPRQADDDFSLPVKSAFFFALLPIALLLAAFGGFRAVGGYGGAIAFGALALALRGRAGAKPFFPLRACLAAPLWVLERSVSVYWALLRKLRGIGDDPGGVPIADRSHARVASGE
jgi:hypothetical protein